MGKLHASLVHATGFEHEIDNRAVVRASPNAQASDGALNASAASERAHPTHHLDMIFYASQVIDENCFTRVGRQAADGRNVTLVDLASLELFGERCIRTLAFGEDDDATRVSVEPLVDPEVRLPRKTIALHEKELQARDEIIGSVWLRGLTRHARRFMDREQVLVFEQNVLRPPRWPHA